MWWKLKNSNCEVTQTQSMTKLTNLNCDKTQKLELWQTRKNQIVTKTKIPLGTKLNSNCNKTKNSNSEKF